MCVLWNGISGCIAEAHSFVSRKQLESRDGFDGLNLLGIFAEWLVSWLGSY
jgi:hypothetical protein